MQSFSLNIRGKLVEYSSPVVMGILNVTPDSFYAGFRSATIRQAQASVEEMVAQGADIIDVGGCSTRPGASVVDAAEELERLRMGINAVRSVSDDIPVSVDTFRAIAARKAIEWGADIINDISGGKADEAMFATVAEMRVPYVLMHMRGTPADMQQHTDYHNVTADVIAELSGSLHELRSLGVADIIVDPGFGFAKTLEQNYQLLKHLPEIEGMLGCPVLVGVSRKSMVTRPCNITPEEALPGTSVLNAYAVMRGASVLRVHDVAAARQAITIAQLLS